MVMHECVACEIGWVGAFAPGDRRANPSSPVTMLVCSLLSKSVLNNDEEQIILLDERKKKQTITHM